MIRRLETLEHDLSANVKRLSLCAHSNWVSQSSRWRRTFVRVKSQSSQVVCLHSGSPLSASLLNKTNNGSCFIVMPSCWRWWNTSVSKWISFEGYSSTGRMSTAMILGLPPLVLFARPADDSSQRSIKSSAEILGDTSAFRSESASGSRDYKKGSQERSKEIRHGWGGGASIACGSTIQIGEGRICWFYRLNSFMPAQFPGRKTPLRNTLTGGSPTLCWGVWETMSCSSTEAQLQWSEPAEMNSLKLPPRGMAAGAEPWSPPKHPPNTPHPPTPKWLGKHLLFPPR